jgi:hypothetical protein
MHLREMQLAVSLLCTLFSTGCAHYSVPAVFQTIPYLTGPTSLPEVPSSMTVSHPDKIPNAHCEARTTAQASTLLLLWHATVIPSSNYFARFGPCEFFPTASEDLYHLHNAGINSMLEIRYDMVEHAHFEACLLQQMQCVVRCLTSREH